MFLLPQFNNEVQRLSKQKGKCYTQCYEKNYAHFNPDDRDRIAVMYNKGTSISDIARELGQNKGIISREIYRNSSLEYDCYLGNRTQQRPKPASKKLAQSSPAA